MVVNRKHTKNTHDTFRESRQLNKAEIELATRAHDPEVRKVLVQLLNEDQEHIEALHNEEERRLRGLEAANAQPFFHSRVTESPVEPHAIGLAVRDQDEPPEKKRKTSHQSEQATSSASKARETYLQEAWYQAPPQPNTKDLSRQWTVLLQDILENARKAEEFDETSKHMLRSYVLDLLADWQKHFPDLDGPDGEVTLGYEEMFSLWRQILRKKNNLGTKQIWIKQAFVDWSKEALALSSAEAGLRKKAQVAPAESAIVKSEDAIIKEEEEKMTLQSFKKLKTEEQLQASRPLQFAALLLTFR